MPTDLTFTQKAERERVFFCPCVMNSGSGRDGTVKVIQKVVIMLIAVGVTVGETPVMTGCKSHTITYDLS